MDMQVRMQFGETLSQLTIVGWYSVGFVAMVLLVYLIRRLVTQKRTVNQDATWGCGYTGQTGKMQYTASSFIRTYRKLAEPLLLIKKEKKEAKGLYPGKILQKTHAMDKIEYWLIDKPLFLIRRTLNSFVFLQNGNIQAYMLYGFVFVGLALLLPLIFEKIAVIINFLNHL